MSRALFIELLHGSVQIGFVSQVQLMLRTKHNLVPHVGPHGVLSIEGGVASQAVESGSYLQPALENSILFKINEAKNCSICSPNSH